ncbi:FAS1-like dehydratase domain-containing protein [Solirhodobacter olei]|uniref:FAS1-like dehydratase domain-containing protein n=1 Tax=Solirhodobacter olei TaxID=2493082 RepID=UPI000FD89064|nr:MaoC family dehydratase N-terminal domain-containing protein [Solirhodobacter olei]
MGEPEQNGTEIEDRMDPARAAALAAALGFDWQPDDPLPPFFHQAYFWQPRPEAELGRDGHSARGGLIPDLGLPRRMWAGGRLLFHAPLRPGLPARRATRVEGATRKTGRSGPLAFVTLRHDITQRGMVCVSEWQDLVFRADPDPAAPTPEPPRAPDGAQAESRARFSTTTLFRYSALTFNGHRIHYDLDYCREVEGYPGLVVHGPLLAQILMLMAPGPLRSFRFRATAPLFHFEEARFCRAGKRLWVAGPDGRLCMEAEAG